jgi:serine phosphatase RsbU (regulator of sigma subunit)
MEPGASLLLYTDGIFEAENPAGQPLGSLGSSD